MFSLEGHTGGGIGLATARVLAHLKANIVIADLNDEAGHNVVSALTAEGCKAAFVRTDVSNADDVDALIAATLDTFGSLEILMQAA